MWTRRGLVGHARIVHPERDVANAVAMSSHVLGDRPAAGHRRGEDESDLPLRQQVAGPVANAGFRAAVADDLKAQRRLIEMRRLLRVPDVELDVVRSVDREGGVV